MDAIALDGKVELSWKAAPGAGGCAIFRGTTPSTVDTRLNPTAVTGTLYTDTTAANGQAYYYEARSIVGGAVDPVAPYSAAWDTTAVANGSHTLTAVARDVAGNTTTSAPVTVTVSNAASPPTVTARTPAAGATGVGTGTTVTATFSRALDPASATTTSFTLARPDGSLVPAAVAAAGATATLTPSAALANSTTYTATLTTGIRAVDGTALAAPVTWTFTTAAAGNPVRINAGGAAYTSATLGAFTADASFTGGSTYSSSAAISGTSDAPLYQNERWGQFSYAITVPNGNYDVRLHFVELYYTAPCVGQRIFSIDILDTPAPKDVADLDVCAAVGPKTALVRTVSNVTVSDGVLNLQSVYGAVDDPELAAVEVIPR